MSAKLSLAQTDAILCAPGMPHELELRLIDGRLNRVYKNLWPSLRAFWLWASNVYTDRTYIVFETQRWTYGQISDRAARAASIYQDIYGVRKGDRVGICARNSPDYLVSFWACHLIGAVSVLANAWLPLASLHHCLAHAQCKLIILDPERALCLEPVISQLASETGTSGFLVLQDHEPKRQWAGMETWDDVINSYRGDIRKILEDNTDVLPEDNATIIFTSGTTGLPKGVLSTQRMFLTNVLNVLVGSSRAAVRRGDDITSPPAGPQKGVLISVPFFHVTGSTSLSMMASLKGLKIVLMRQWIPEEAARLIKDENVGVAGGVPSMVSDLIASSAVGYPLDALLFGGSPAPDHLPEQARQAFPTASMSQAYGMTETNSVAVSVAGEDYISRPSSTSAAFHSGLQSFWELIYFYPSSGRPSPVNDIVIMQHNTAVSSPLVGEVWLRGPNVMKGYWRDPEATAKTLTKDGWLKTGDLGFLDEEGFLYIRDRIKDLIIRGGENVASVAVENALYADPRLSEVAAVGVPDKRLGELVVAVVFVKPAFRGTISEAELIRTAETRLPKFAVPVMIIIQDSPFERTPSGKILKQVVRESAKAEWERRCRVKL